MPDSARPTDYAAALGRVATELDLLVEHGASDALRRRAAWTAALDQPLPEAGVGAAAVLEEIAENLIPNGSRISDPRCWGWIVSLPGPVAVAASAAGSVAASQRYTINAFNLLEELSLSWLAQLCGLDSTQMRGIYSSGGSVANLVALGAARQWAFEQRGVDPAADGIGGTTVAIYASEETHHTVHRAAAVLGLGRSSVRPIPVDDRQQMRPDDLLACLSRDIAAGVLPVAIVANAGTTNTGAIDPLRAVGTIAREHDVWFHIDGAYGLLGGLDERIRHRYEGVELADSAIVDPHKWLSAPTGIAATFVRDRSILHRAFTQEPAPYLETVFSGDGLDIQTSMEHVGIPYSEFGVELSAPPRGAVVWSILRELGRSGVARRIRADNDHALRLAELSEAHPKLELMAAPALSITCFRYKTTGIDDLDAFNEALYYRLIRETPYMPSTTRVRGALALRPCFVNDRTRPEHIDGMVEAVVAIGDSMATG